MYLNLVARALKRHSPTVFANNFIFMFLSFINIYANERYPVSFQRNKQVFLSLKGKRKKKKTGYQESMQS